MTYESAPGLNTDLLISTMRNANSVQSKIAMTYNNKNSMRIHRGIPQHVIGKTNKKWQQVYLLKCSSGRSGENSISLSPLGLVMICEVIIHLTKREKSASAVIMA